MRTEPASVCRMEGCGQRVPAQLAQERLCLDHFVEHTYVRAQHAVQGYQEDLPFCLEAVEWMFEDAKFSLMAMVRDTDRPYRENLCELMVCLANLREFVRSHAADEAAAVRQPAAAAHSAGRSAA